MNIQPNNEENAAINARLEKLGFDAEQMTAVRAATDCIGGGVATYKRVLDALESIQNEGVTLAALLDLAELGIPARRLIYQEWNIGDGVPLPAEITGERALHAIGAGLLRYLAQPEFKKNERVRIAPGRAMTGLTGKVRRIHRDGILHTYFVSFDCKSATKTHPFFADDLISLQAPKADDDGGYYTPVFITPGKSEVLLNYPDMMAPTQEGAEACLTGFSNSFSGVVMALNGLQATGRIARVLAKEIYTVAALTVGGYELNVTVLSGHELDQFDIAEFEAKEAAKPESVPSPETAPAEEKTAPENQRDAICRDCGEPIRFDGIGGYWCHTGRTPRHIAIPKENALTP